MIAKGLKSLIPAIVAAGALGTMPVLADEPPVIGVMDGTQVEAYCAFLPGDQEFVYDDTGSWQFVYWTDMSKDAHAFMMLDGVQQQLRLRKKFFRTDFEMRRYEIDGTAYIVEVYMVPGVEGYEHTPYTGAIYVSNGESASAVAFHGDCGV